MALAYQIAKSQNKQPVILYLYERKRTNQTIYYQPA